MRTFLSGLAALSLCVACLTLAPSDARAGGYGGSLYGSAYGGGGSYSMSTGAYAPSYGYGYGNSNFSALPGTASGLSGSFPRVGPVYSYSNNFGAQSTPSYPTYNRGTNYASPPTYPTQMYPTQMYPTQMNSTQINSTQINSTMHMRRWSMRRGY